MACKRSTVRSRLAPPTLISEGLVNTVTPVNAFRFCGVRVQLVGRVHGMQEVDGSIPSSSTTIGKADLRVGFVLSVFPPPSRTPNYRH